MSSLGKMSGTPLGGRALGLPMSASGGGAGFTFYQRFFTESGSVITPSWAKIAVLEGVGAGGNGGAIGGARSGGGGGGDDAIVSCDDGDTFDVTITTATTIKKNASGIDIVDAGAGATHNTGGDGGTGKYAGGRGSQNSGAGGPPQAGIYGGLRGVFDGVTVRAGGGAGGRLGGNGFGATGSSYSGGNRELQGSIMGGYGGGGGVLYTGSSTSFQGARGAACVSFFASYADAVSFLDSYYFDVRGVHWVDIPT